MKFHRNMNSIIKIKTIPAIFFIFGYAYVNMMALQSAEFTHNGVRSNS